MRVNIFRLILSVFICEGAGLVGSIVTFPSISTWYSSLAKPGFTPPSWVFGPVWITLYALMGISLYLMWDKGLFNKEHRLPLSLFAGQLILNALWSFLFFGLQNSLIALIEILVLWVSILATIISFYKISKPASIVLIPYIVWVTIATFLNYYVWVLNP